LLLQHAFIPEGTTAYLAGNAWNLFDTRSFYLRLLEISTNLANAWFDWAFALSMEDLVLRRDNAVLDLLRDLIRSKSLKEFLE
jgi:hypothetical protein